MIIGWTSILIALLSGPLQEDGPQGGNPAFDRGSIRELYVGLPPGTRVEYFRLDREPSPDAEENEGRVPGPSGLVRWVVGPDPEREDAWRVEFEASFFETQTRVIHTERLRSRMRELVFREVRPQAGRTLYLSWDPALGVRSIEMMGGELRREEIDPGRGAMFPLSVIEMFRQGVDFQGAVPVFQPLRGAPEALDVSVREAGGERVLEFRREGGLLAGSYSFRDKQLSSFRWQDGGAVATRIPRAMYEALLATGNEQLATAPAPQVSRY